MGRETRVVMTDRTAVWIFGWINVWRLNKMFIVYVLYPFISRLQLSLKKTGLTRPQSGTRGVLNAWLV